MSREASSLRAATLDRTAEAAMILGDPESYKALWSRGDDVSLFGAFGPCKKGWHQLEKTFDWVAAATAKAWSPTNTKSCTRVPTSRTRLATRLVTWPSTGRR